MNRRLQPEWLDQLPSGDPRAIRSRRDLRRVNAWMGNARIMSRELQRAFAGEAPRCIIEIGAGDGALLLHVARRTNGYFRNLEAVLVDRQPLLKPETRAKFTELNWRIRAAESDALQFLQDRSEPADAIAANLFLHHFTDEELKRLFQLAAERARVVVAVEPRRSWFSLLFSRLVWVIGGNAVTRHDAVVSVRAGFAGRELSALWPERARWKLTERRAGWFSHLFVAQRKE